MLSEEAVSFMNRGHFTTIDYVIFVLLIVVSILIGLFVGVRGWKKSTVNDFLVGGRKMHLIPVSLSLIGGVVSALSLLGNPSEMYQNGTQLWMMIFGAFYGTLFIVFVVLPTLYPLELISVMQMFHASLYCGICLYAPSLALSSMTTLPTWASIMLLGLVCTFYISIGGVKAVVYTDVVQTLLMFAGIIVVIIVVCIELGGFEPVLEIANAGGRLEFLNLDTSPFVRHTFWSVQVFGLYFLFSLGLSQPQFQRLSSLRTLRTAQGAGAIFYIGMAILWSLFNFTGLVAYATYADCDPLSSKQIEKPDQIVPFLVADKLRRFPGMAGLFVAAVYGAVLSSVSSQANAFAVLMWEDFLSEWGWFRKSFNISPTNITRILSALAGLTGVCLSFVVSQLGTILQLAYSVTGAIVGPLDGLFFTAICAPWVTAKGALVGFVAAFLFNVWLLVGKYLNQAGLAKPLPLSTSGCPSIWNSTLDFEENLLPENNFSSQFNEERLNELEERDYLAFYDISYCYLGIMGILIVFLVSSFVSIITGPNKPDEIDEKLVHKPILKAYKCVWSLFTRRRKFVISQIETKPSIKYTIPSPISDDEKEKL